MFNHLKKLDINEATAEFRIYQIEGEPVIILRPATEANKPYFNQVLKKSNRRLKRIQKGSINSAVLEETRALDRELFPKFVIIGWRDLTDENGETVDFDSANCAAFVQALPDWIFDEIRNFAGMSSNFIDDPFEDLGEKVGN